MSFTSTPWRGSCTAARVTPDEVDGSEMRSSPAEALTGNAISSRRTARPAWASTADNWLAPFPGRGDQRDQLAVEPGFSHQQAGRDRDPHPAIFQHVNGEAGAAGGQVAGNAQVIVDARERGIHRRRLRIALGGKGASAKIW